MHDAFFDRVISGALDRGVTQIVLVGADHDGRAQRHDRPGVRWWEIDAPAALTGRGFEPDSPALFCCDGVASGLSRAALASLLGGLRALATPGTRLALALPAGVADEDLGRWRAVEISERAQRAGLRLLAPVWAPGAPPSAGRIAQFTERMLYRSGGDEIAGHLEAVYGVTVKSTRELDLGVHRADLAGGASWIARIFPAARDIEAVRHDAQLLRWLTAAGFPAERCADPEPVSVLAGQGVLVTERVAGRALPAKPASFELLGRLLGQLHSMDAEDQRPGGAWHHLLLDGSTAGEVAAVRTLLKDARPRVRAGDGDRYETLAAVAEGADACTDLPHAVVHPDCVPRNAIGRADGDVTLID
jgi:Phosphotransferase enzyme family/Leucine carboxyl methyltransferase